MFGLGSTVQAIMAAVLAAAIVGGIQQYRVNSLKTDVAVANKDYSDLKLKHTRLAGAVNIQNIKVNDISRNCTQKSASAEVAALRAMSKNEPAKRAIEKGTGPVEMNKWLQDTFAQ
mgnify:CR=1 FL=1